MKRLSLFTLLTACFLMVVAGPVFAQSKWVVQQQDLGDDTDVVNMSIVDEGNVFFAMTTREEIGGSALFPTFQKTYLWYSNDAGQTLQPRYQLTVPTAPSDPTFGWDMITVRDVYMRSATEGFVCGLYSEGSLFASIGNMTPWVGYTSDGGQTFTKFDEFEAGLIDATDLLAIEFDDPTNPSKGIAVGNSSSSWYTDGVGSFWTKYASYPDPGYFASQHRPTILPNLFYTELTDVAFDGNAGVYVTGSYVYTSVDDDDYWNDDDDSWSGDDDDETKGEDQIGAQYGELFFSSDNGSTWSSILTYELFGYDEAGFPHVTFFGKDKGWVTIIGTKDGDLATDIIYTADAGATWQASTLPSDTDHGAPGDYVIYDVAFSKESLGWAVGYTVGSGNAVILSTTDGGVTWAFDEYSGKGELRNVETLGHRRAWAIGANKTILYFFNDDNEIPVAVAGDDQEVNPGATVALDGSGSYDPDGDDIVTYFWELVDGANAVLDNTGAVAPTFTTDSENACYVFALTVTDDLGGVSEPDYVSIFSGSTDCEEPQPTDDDDDTGDDDDDDTDDDTTDDDDDDDDDSGCCG